MWFDFVCCTTVFVFSPYPVYHTVDYVATLEITCNNKINNIKNVNIIYHHSLKLNVLYVLIYLHCFKWNLFKDFMKFTSCVNLCVM
ncbi:hypothetical protein XELAEV_18015334mg [Xenopus laevis]|uniref:Uncharacterized protein n=1 Tax=Xenopus laevis TaxID=8355 RepID=A0A974DI60_XENLA|nr:hypothetical protein XELAEV_18015334mg [Xenopus laevis]